MKILEKEIALREETRALQQAKPQIKKEEFEKRAKSLKKTQATLAGRTEDVIADIEDLPDGAQMFKREIHQLTKAAEAMWDAEEILGNNDTGPKAIAAETEAIEWLLQAKRSKGGGGGGGSSPGDGNRTGKDSNVAALALMGESREKNANTVQREVTQATGQSGEELPAEFRAGLDKYFEAIEKRNK